MNETTNKNTLHSFRYENGKICISGVVNVDCFDERCAELRLFDSSLTLKGSGFKLEDMELKSGILNMDGKLSSVTYHDKGEKISFVKRLFK